ncbi:subclass B3 metallo-beta-lactamase [Mucilaginibacter sp. RS28]|uniref:Subclass B3 metallo-beta-lactamase n=1 Tax=Mucilaginibacter straminoryzae TaxID=2932774 RepID=A0A9X2BA52_9SPHI|nr:subclass B3 metallo-beta-lactamase [Mucilaginibacter straminoryzae]MCJ8211364.1 subclass B3 metallo-beta-lactamase [Mucilaginibacter straminoryzae]
MRFAFIFLLFFVISSPLAFSQTDPDWTTAIAPFQISDHLYYVGSKDLASYLIVTPKGNILINANLPSSPPLIRRSVGQLGFRWKDIKILLNSQAHFDHMGGAAQVIRETGAKNMVMDDDVDVVKTGGEKDFLSPSPNLEHYPPCQVDSVLHDGSTISLGGVKLYANKTAGHTRGCTTWTMQDHLPGEPKNTRRNIVIIGGTSFWSEYHFVPTANSKESYPGIAADFEKTFAKLQALPCDIFLGAHGKYFNLLTKLERYVKEGPKVFIDPSGYRKYVAEAKNTFFTELSKQQATTH